MSVTGFGLIFSMMMMCFFVDYVAGEDIVYLKNNVHFQIHKGDNKASYANWTNPGKGHSILSVNTPVTIKKKRKAFIIKNTLNNEKIYFEFHETNMSMKLEQYLNLITSSAKVSLAGFSENDMKGIQDGKAYPGMTKNGVRVALGYPAAHKTPSLDSNTWVYWTNRFRSVDVVFNDLGEVVSAP